MLIDDLTDIAVQEQMICFVQYVGKRALPEVKFLFLANLLKDSLSANAATIKSTLLNGLAEKELEQDQFVALCTDGAAVMLSNKNGLAGLLLPSVSARNS